jgi:predicted methyltransferase
MKLINPTHQQFLKMPLHGKLEFLRYLASSNSLASAAKEEDAETSGSWQQLWRSYHQLPCSRKTRERRARFFLEMGFQHKSVCLLGDDDRVAVELIKLGFTRVTVFDCDPQILESIARDIPDSRRSCIELKKVDFNDRGALSEGFADLVCIDPPYNREGALLFIRTALFCLSGHPDAKLVLMTIPQLFENRNQDWATIEALLSRSRLHQTERLRSFNSYPLNPVSRFFLFSVFCFLNPLRRSKPAMDGIEFFSDCLIWERRS